MPTGAQVHWAEKPMPDKKSSNWGLSVISKLAAESPNDLHVGSVLGQTMKLKITMRVVSIHIDYLYLDTIVGLWHHLQSYSVNTQMCHIPFTLLCLEENSDCLFWWPTTTTGLKPLQIDLHPAKNSTASNSSSGKNWCENVRMDSCYLCQFWGMNRSTCKTTCWYVDCIFTMEPHTFVI